VLGADTAKAQTFDAAHPGIPSCSPKTAICQKNYESMVGTDWDRSLRRRLQTFNLPLPSSTNCLGYLPCGELRSNDQYATPRRMPPVQNLELPALGQLSSVVGFRRYALELDFGDSCPRPTAELDQQEAPIVNESGWKFISPPLMKPPCC